MRFLLVINLLLTLLSCSIVKHDVSKPCTFDPSTLTVMGQDSVSYGCIDSRKLPIDEMYWLLNVSYKNGFEPIIASSSYFDDNIHFKICNCKDTTWAKQQILSEIAKQHPYSIVDSFIIKKYYDFNIRDSSNLSPYVFDGMYRFRTEDLGNGIVLEYETIYVGYLLLTCLKDYRRHDDGIYYFELGNVNPPYFREHVHSVKLPHKFLYGGRPYDEFINYMRDSLGVDISVNRLDTIPKKIIVFDAVKHHYPDTICIQKVYGVKLVDTSLLVKSNFQDKNIGGKISGKIDDYLIYYGYDFKEFGNLIVPKPFPYELCGKSIANMVDTLPGKYDIKVFNNLAKSITKESEYIKMVRDSLGFEIKWIRDELVKNKRRKRYY